MARINLTALEGQYRRKYLSLERRVTHQEMADVTGLPKCTFTMWLRDFRRVTKLTVLQSLMDGYARLVVLAKGRKLRF